MTDAQRAGWYGVGGLVALAGLGALLEGGGRRVANPRRARRRNPAALKEGAAFYLEKAIGEARANDRVTIVEGMPGGGDLYLVRPPRGPKIWASASELLPAPRWEDED